MTYFLIFYLPIIKFSISCRLETYYIPRESPELAENRYEVRFLNKNSFSRYLRYGHLGYNCTGYDIIQHRMRGVFFADYESPTILIKTEKICFQIR